jgi:hypothetical protein
MATSSRAATASPSLPESSWVSGRLDGLEARHLGLVVLTLLRVLVSSRGDRQAPTHQPQASGVDLEILAGLTVGHPRRVSTTLLERLVGPSEAGYPGLDQLTSALGEAPTPGRSKPLCLEEGNSNSYLNGLNNGVPSVNACTSK